MSGRLYLSAALPTFDPVVFGDDEVLEYSMLWDKVTTNLDTGQVTRTAESWDVSLSRDEPTMQEHRDYPAPSGNQSIRLENFRTNPPTDDRIEGAMVTSVAG